MVDRAGRAAPPGRPVPWRRRGYPRGRDARRSRRRPGCGIPRPRAASARPRGAGPRSGPVVCRRSWPGVVPNGGDRPPAPPRRAVGSDRAPSEAAPPPAFPRSARWPASAGARCGLAAEAAAVARSAPSATTAASRGTAAEPHRPPRARTIAPTRPMPHTAQAARTGAIGARATPAANARARGARGSDSQRSRSRGPGGDERPHAFELRGAHAAHAPEILDGGEGRRVPRRDDPRGQRGSDAGKARQLVRRRPVEVDRRGLRGARVRAELRRASRRSLGGAASPPGVPTPPRDRSARAAPRPPGGRGANGRRRARLRRWRPGREARGVDAASRRPCRDAATARRRRLECENRYARCICSRRCSPARAALTAASSALIALAPRARSAARDGRSRGSRRAGPVLGACRSIEECPASPGRDERGGRGGPVRGPPAR